MAKQCQICGKTSQKFRKLVKLRGKYNPSTKKRRYPNLQWVRVPGGTKRKKFKSFAGKRILACTKCIKTLGKIK
ncbi:MAG: large ribosomal subunit protein bL28 [Candidatus Nealsonbacteria bacterium]